MKKVKLGSGAGAGTKAGKRSYEEDGGGTLPRKRTSVAAVSKAPKKVPAGPGSSSVGTPGSSSSAKSDLIKKRKSCPNMGTAGSSGVGINGGMSSIAAFLTPERISRVFQPGEGMGEADVRRETKRLVMCLASLVKNQGVVHLNNTEIGDILGTLLTHVDSIDDENWNVIQQAILFATTPRNCGSCFSTLESLINEVLVHRPVYASSIAHILISKLVRPNPERGVGPLEDDGPTLTELKSFEVSVKLICRVVEVVGIKRLNRALINIMSSNYPYVLKPALTHFYYIRNILTINRIIGNSLTYSVLSVVFHKLTHLDALIPREILDSERLQDLVLPKREKTATNNINSFIIPEEEAQELALEIVKSYAKVANEVEQAQQIAALDISLSYLISFLSSVQETLNFNSLLSIFEAEVLPTFNTNCIQFAFFYLINQKEEYLNAFLEFLWKKFLLVNTPAVIRIQAVGYISGVLSRSTTVDRRTLKRWISRLSAFAHEYLNSKSSATASHWANVNIHAHGPFYAVCQAIFYTFAFRHFELVYGNMPFFKEEGEEEEGKKSAEQKSKPNLQTLPPPSSSSFIYSLNLQRLITCDLNPLKACTASVAKTFVDAAHAYQISYCKTVLERNNRANIRNMIFENMRDVSNSEYEGVNILNDSFFPFDPLPLAYTKMIIDDDFRVYDGNSIALSLVGGSLDADNGIPRRTRKDSRGPLNDEDDNCDDLELGGEEDDEVDGGNILLASCE